MLHSDSPITKKDEDELGTYSFVERLVEPLVGANPATSLVVGLYGQWGHGKSSALNLLHDVLRNRTEGVRSVTVRFNPWLYTDTESLLLSFFGTLTAEIGGGEFLTKDQKATFKAAIAGLASFATPILKVAVPGAIGAIVQGSLAGAQKLLDGGEKSFHSQKEDISEILASLAERKLRIVVLIDDLDRANASEIRTVLRLVKLVADLPNISYLLSMDDRRVRAVLSENRPDGYGADYLEKIVQVAVYLPPVAPDRLRDLVLTALLKELEEAKLDGSELAKGRYEGGVDYHSTLGRRIRNLRDRARFLNALRFVLRTGPRRLDLNGRDVVLLAFLQTFFADAYDAVRYNRTFLTGMHEGFGDFLASEAAKKRAVEERAGRLRQIAGYELAETASGRDRGRVAHEAETALTVLRLLFPYAELGNAADGADKSRAENRIASLDRFDLYFSLTPPPNEVPDDDVLFVIAELNALDGAQNATESAERVMAVFAPFVQAGPEAQASFIEKLLDRFDRVDLAQAEAIARGLLGLESDFGAERIVRLTMELAVRTAAPQFTDEDTVIPDDGPTRRILGLLVLTLRNEPMAIDVANDWAGGANGIKFSKQTAAEVTKLGLQRARSYFAAHADVFADAPGMEAVELVWNWMRLSTRAGESGDEVRQYLKKLLDKHPERLSEVVGLSAGWSNDNPSFRVQRVSEALASISKLIDVDWLKDRVREKGVGSSAKYPHLLEAIAKFVDSQSPSEP